MLDLGNNRRIPTTAHVRGIPSFSALVLPHLLGLTFSHGPSTSSCSSFLRCSNSFTYSSTPIEAPEPNHRHESKRPWTTDQLRLLASLLPKKGPIIWEKIAKMGVFDPPRSETSLETAYRKHIKGRSREESRPLTGGPVDVFRVDPKRALRWTLEEDYILAKGVELRGAQNWDLIAAYLPGRRPTDCSTRWGHYKEQLARWVVPEWDEVQKGVQALETLVTTLMREAPEKNRRTTIAGMSTLKPILDAVKVDLAEKGEELPPQFLTTMMLRRFFAMVTLYTCIAKRNIRRYPEVSMYSPQVAAIKLVAERSWREYKTGKLPEELKVGPELNAAAQSKADPSPTKGRSTSSQQMVKVQAKNQSSGGKKKTTGKGVSVAPKLKVVKVDKPRKD
ncbi:hypothetical protein M427DRAFT_57607, partial [Gonapodya prolifera JEL478]